MNTYLVQIRGTFLYSALFVIRRIVPGMSYTETGFQIKPFSRRCLVLDASLKLTLKRKLTLKLTLESIYRSLC